MAEAELEIFRLKMRVEAVYVVMRGLFVALARLSPDGTQTILEAFALLRRMHGHVALPDLPAEYSDMAAGEYQEALDELLSYIAEGLHRPA